MTVYLKGTRNTLAPWSLSRQCYSEYKYIFLKWFTRFVEDIWCIKNYKYIETLPSGIIKITYQQLTQIVKTVL